MACRTSLLSTTALSLLIASGSVAPSLAADMAVKARPLPPRPVLYSWTGFYIGANVGAAFIDSSMTETTTPAFSLLSSPTSSLNRTTALGGFQAGYNWQTGNVVFGIEGDYDFLSSTKSVSFNGGFDVQRSRYSGFATIRGRLGLLVEDRFLVYATGGAAFADIKNQLIDNAIPFTVGRDGWTTGWTAGGGVEYAFLNNWTVKAEGLFAQFPNHSSFVPVLGNPAGGYSFAFKDSVTVGRVGINYKF
jgi:outer membrane immunogenic protein